MEFQISEEPIATLAEQARISIAFEVDRVLDVLSQEGDPSGFALSERRIDIPYLKDYDAIESEGPSTWATRFDVSNWGLIVARVSGRRVGGAVIAIDTPAVTMLEDRTDLAVLWDIRVSPEARGRGIGSALFCAAEAWALARGCREIKVETQNINVAACRFYAKRKCALRDVRRLAYPEFPEEIQLIWCKHLNKADLSF